MVWQQDCSVHAHLKIYYLSTIKLLGCTHYKYPFSSFGSCTCIHKFSTQLVKNYPTNNYVLVVFPLLLILAPIGRRQHKVFQKSLSFKAHNHPEFNNPHDNKSLVQKTYRSKILDALFSKLGSGTLFEINISAISNVQPTSTTRQNMVLKITIKFYELIMFQKASLNFTYTSLVES